MKSLVFFTLIIFVKLNIFAELSLTLTKRQLCDLELIMNGGFKPLMGFLCQNDYNEVINKMRLVNGELWPIPIILDVKLDFIKSLSTGSEVLLLSPDGHNLAVLYVEDIWKPNKLEEALKVYGTTDSAHPGVDYLINETYEYYIGGKIKKLAAPKYYDFTDLRKDPEEIKNYFKEKNIKKIVAFQTRNPLHRAHVELTKLAMKDLNAHLLLHPTVGLTKPGDVDHFTRVKCYKKLLKYYPEESITLSLLPISMRMAGPREALWHAIIRKNYGATHFIIGRDHAGPGKDKNGNDFYGPYDAQDLVIKYENEIGIKVVPFKQMVYVENLKTYLPEDQVPSELKTLNISGTQFRQMLHEGKEIPEWFSYPEVVEELKKVYKEKTKQGLTIFFTGLSGAGKSTIANALTIKLMEIQNRSITILDGDIIRTHLSNELGFSKEHRSINVRRVGFVANEITKNGGIAICALIAPYEKDREYNHNLINPNGKYIEVFISTPLSVCEERDEKGLYAKAREGLIPNFTGISDPYEDPTNPDLIIDTSELDVDKSIEIIIEYIKRNGLIN